MRDKKQHIKQLVRTVRTAQAVHRHNSQPTTPLLKQSIVRSPERLKRSLADLTAPAAVAARATLDAQQQLRTERTTTLLSLNAHARAGARPYWRPGRAEAS